MLAEGEYPEHAVSARQRNNTTVSEVRNRPLRIDLTIHSRGSTPPNEHADPEELCLARFRSTVVHDGFFEEDGVIWAADGTVLAQSRQLALLLALPGR